MIGRLVPALLVVSLLSACIGVPPSPDEGQGTSGDLPVQAPAAMAEAMTALVTKFHEANQGVNVQLTFAAPGATDSGSVPPTPDVLISETTMTQNPAGVVVASTQLVIAVPAANPKGIARLSDLTALGNRVALCETSQACGAATEQLLADTEVRLPEAGRFPDTRKALAEVQNGTADAALVYRTDARSAGADVATIEITESGMVPVNFVAAATGSPKLPEAATAFVHYLVSDEAKEKIASFGFGTS
jgi:molybdate transport system substrate-binding protein